MRNGSLLGRGILGARRQPWMTMQKNGLVTIVINMGNTYNGLPNLQYVFKLLFFAKFTLKMDCYY